MTRRILIILLNNIVCLASLLAQNSRTNAAAKLANDACPTWNNKQNVSKADYFMFLRKTSKASKTNEYSQYNQTNKNFDKPLYTSLVPQKTVPKNNMSDEKPEDHIETIPEEMPASIPTINVQSVQEISEQVAKPDLRIIPEMNNEENKSINLPKEEVKNAAIEKDKVKKKSNFLNRNKTERKHWLRKINFRKKGAAKCPDF